MDDTDLSAHPVRRRPQGIVLLRDFTVVNDPLQLLHHALVNVRLKPEKHTLKKLISFKQYRVENMQQQKNLTSFLIMTSFL